jgi:hypothetical protein
VRNLGVTRSFFTDHVDVRPTLLFLSGLEDDYLGDGRVILETIDPAVLPPSLRANSTTLLQLGQLYKALEAPFGQLAHDAWTVSTFAILSSSPNDSIYSQLESDIGGWTIQRDSLGEQIKDILNAAEFEDQAINESQASALIAQGQALLDQVAIAAKSL